MTMDRTAEWKRLNDKGAALGICYVCVCTTMQGWILHSPVAPNPQALLDAAAQSSWGEADQHILLRKYLSPAGNAILNEYSMQGGTGSGCGMRGLRVEICGPNDTLHARHIQAIAEQLQNPEASSEAFNVGAEGNRASRSDAGIQGRCCWEVSSETSGRHALHMLHERVCISEMPRFLINGSASKVQYELHPGRLLDFARDNAYRALTVGGLGGGSSAVPGINGAKPEQMQAPDEPLLWTLVRRHPASKLPQALALINAAESRVECLRGVGMGAGAPVDLSFVVAVASAMTLSLASNEHEWKLAGQALQNITAGRLALAARAGQKRICHDNGWRVLASVWR